jgi:hypothetical protein
VLFFIGFDKLKGIWEAGSFEMAIQQQKLSALLATIIDTHEYKFTSKPYLLS